MPPFHNNKLNTISLDESDNQCYSPAKKISKSKKQTPRSAPKSKPKPKPRIKNISTKGSDLTAMGCIPSCIPSKRDHSGNASTTAAAITHGHGQSMASMPGEPISRFPSTDSSAAGMIPLEALGRHFDQAGVLQRNNQSSSFANNVHDWDNVPSRGYEILGDQNRLHLGGYDIDLRVPLEYPNSPRKNAFAAQENRNMFYELPGNPYDSSESLNYGGYEPRINFEDTIDCNSYIPPSALKLFSSMQGLGRSEAQSFDCENDRSEDVPIKEEGDVDNNVSTAPQDGSEYEESSFEDEPASKKPKLNKDGAPRKPRQPRPKLLKWNDNDWKNVALGIVWACGENGIPIPFDQAAQIVGSSCTAGALQQAILKLRLKQIDEGYQIPLLRMAWTRKNRNIANTINSQDPPPDKTITPKKRPTHQECNQSLLITLKRAYHEADREHLEYPHRFKKLSLQQQRTRTSNTIMMNTNSSGDIDDQHANIHNEYERGDHDMVDNHDDLGLGLTQNPATGNANFSDNDLAVWTANVTDSGPLPTQVFGQLPFQDQAFGSYEPWAGHKQGGSGKDAVLASMIGQNNHGHSLSGFKEESLSDPTRSTIRRFGPEDQPLSDDKMRKRNTEIVDSHWHEHVHAMNPNFFDPAFTAASAFPSQGPVVDFTSAASSVYGVRGNSAPSTVPTTPAASSVFSHNIRLSTPNNGSFVSAFDNTPIAGDTSYTDILGAYDTPATASAFSAMAPLTPPRSARADFTVSNLLNSSLRQDGAFTPQGPREYTHHYINDLSEDIQRELQPNNEEDVKYGGHGGLEDPFA